jgi:hypothetical protein
MHNVSVEFGAEKAIFGILKNDGNANAYTAMYPTSLCIESLRWQQFFSDSLAA